MYVRDPSAVDDEGCARYQGIIEANSGNWRVVNTGDAVGGKDVYTPALWRDLPDSAVVLLVPVAWLQPWLTAMAPSVVASPAAAAAAPAAAASAASAAASEATRTAAASAATRRAAAFAAPAASSAMSSAATSDAVDDGELALALAGGADGAEAYDDWAEAATGASAVAGAAAAAAAAAAARALAAALAYAGTGAGGAFTTAQNPPLPPADQRLQWAIGTGLHNLGSSCYMNAVTQCLLHCEPFVHWCMQHAALCS